MGKKKYNLDDVREILKEYGGTLLSKEYLNTKQKLKIRCGSCGKEFERCLGKILDRKSAICRNCGSRNGAIRRTLKIEKIAEYINSLGGSLLSTDYINARTPLKLKCPNCNNDFYREFQVIKKDKTVICKNCSAKKSNEPNKLSFEEVKEYIEKLGGTLISTEYKDNSSNLEIKCSCGRTIKRSIGNIKKRNSIRCEICTKKISNGEMEILRILEENKIDFEYQYIFEECKYKGVLKFDFFIPSLNIAIEYDGEFHYRVSDYFGGQEKLEAQLKRDRIKDEFCLEKNIELIRIPYWNFKNIKNILIENMIIPS